jgi:hypothetical protein
VPQGVGKLPCCQPMLDEVTGPVAGVEVKAGAVQLDCAVWAPNQVADPSPRHTSQHVPLDDRAVRVTVPLADPAPLPVPTPLPAPAAASAPLMAAPMDPPAPPEAEGLPPVEVAPLPLVTVMLTVDAVVVGPATYETDGSEADSVLISREP